MVIGYQTYPDFIGGTEVTIYRFSNLLQKQAIHLGLATNEYGHNLNSEELKQFDLYPIKGGNKRIFSHFMHLISLFKNLLKFRPDGILIFGIFDYSFIGLLYAKIFGKKIIIRTEGDDINFLGNPVRFFQKKLMCRYSDQIMCVSPAQIPLVKRFHPKTPPLLLFSGTDLPSSGKLVSKMANQFNILFVGRLRPEKNVKTLLKAFNLLLQHEKELPKEICLTVCCDGPERNELEQIAQKLINPNKITFTKNVSREKLNELYAQADLFVLPSLYEGFPLVIAEALSYGCPIVCSRLPSLSIVLKENINCVFFDPPTDPQKLHSALFSLLTNDDLRTKMSSENLRLSNIFSWNYLGTKLWNIISTQLDS